MQSNRHVIKTPPKPGALIKLHATGSRNARDRVFSAHVDEWDVRRVWNLTGTESSVERSGTVLPENTALAAWNESDSADQKFVGGASGATAVVSMAAVSSAGNSRRSSIWSKKLPQSMSSMKFPIIFPFFFPEKMRSEKMEEKKRNKNSVFFLLILRLCLFEGWMSVNGFEIGY